MRERYPPFKSALFDMSGIGFGKPAPGGNWYRALYISAICHNVTDSRVIVLNADGLALPMEHNRFALPKLLAHAYHHEFGCVAGEGQYAMKASEHKALEGAGRLKEWVVYRFSDPHQGFANDPAVYAAYREKCVLEARENVESVWLTAREALWPEEYRMKRSAPDQPGCREQLKEKRRQWVEEQVQAQQEIAAKDCDETHAKLLEFDRKVSAWLRGDVGHPPMLAAMMGSA